MLLGSSVNGHGHLCINSISTYSTERQEWAPEEPYHGLLPHRDRMRHLRVRKSATELDSEGTNRQEPTAKAWTAGPLTYGSVLRHEVRRRAQGERRCCAAS